MDLQLVQRLVSTYGGVKPDRFAVNLFNSQYSSCASNVHKEWLCLFQFTTLCTQGGALVHIKCGTFSQGILFCSAAEQLAFGIFSHSPLCDAKWKQGGFHFLKKNPMIPLSSPHASSLLGWTSTNFKLLSVCTGSTVLPDTMPTTSNMQRLLRLYFNAT